MEELPAQLIQFRRKTSTHLVQGDPVRSRIAGSDQIGHGLSLRKIHLAVQEGSLGEFSRHSQLSPGCQQQLKYLLLDIGRTMAGDLHHILSGVGVW